MAVQEVKETTTGAIDLQYSIAPAKAGTFSAAFINFNVAPTATGTLEIKIKYDDIETTIYSVDPSASRVKNIYFSPEVAIPLKTDDKIVLTYPNPNTRTINVLMRGHDNPNP